jgi:hypothetical protein
MAMFKFQTERRDGEKVEKSVVLIKDYPAIVVGVAILAIVIVLVAFIFKSEISAWLNAA